MPEKPKDTTDQPAQEQPQQPAQENAPENQPAQPVADTQQPTQASDTTVPGGIYVIDGRAVDANGQPVKGYKVVDGQAVKE